MAETRARNSDTTTAQGGPVLRPGRPADPGQVSSGVPVDRADSVPDERDAGEAGDHPPANTGEATGGESVAESGDDTSTEASSGADEAERRFAESRQRRLRRLLRQCERINLMDFNILSLAGWPDNYTLNAARRRRDSWLLSATIAALVFLSGMTGFVPAWIAGGGFGAFVVILLMGVPFVRRLYSSKSSYLDLILYRQQLLRDARKHIAHLEGELGLIWQCNELSEFNPTLSSPRFSTLKHLSEQRRLAGSLSRREHIRLYLIFMLEAEKAYERMQNVYFEEHQKAIDRGWQSVARAVTEPEGRQGVREEIAEGEADGAGKARKPDHESDRGKGPDKAASA
ncbi:hypothetical protein [Marinobacter sp. LN3S78]|uniref:hypothetical protein n=1 Tax=Marinobacter sp. LN3S78 TaxID=3382300 RepID=UPI00387B2ABA